MHDRVPNLLALVRQQHQFANTVIQAKRADPTGVAKNARAQFTAFDEQLFIVGKLTGIEVSNGLYDGFSRN